MGWGGFKPKHFVEVMTRRSGTAVLQLNPLVPPVRRAPEPTKHSGAIYSHIHGIKRTHKHARFPADTPGTYSSGHSWGSLR